MAYNSAPLISKSHLVIFLTLGYLRGLGHKSCNDVTVRKQNCYKHLLWNGAFGFLLSGSPEWTVPVISSLHPQGSPLSGNRQALKKLILEGTGLGWWVGAWLGLYFFFFLRAGFNFVTVFLGNQGVSFFTWFWTGSEAEIKIEKKKWKNTFTPAANDLLLHVIISTCWSRPFCLLMWSLPQFCHIN